MQLPQLLSLCRKSLTTVLFLMSTAACFAQGGTVETWGMRVLPPGDMTGYTSAAAGLNHTIDTVHFVKAPQG